MKLRFWECEQGSEEWHQLRMGIPTASQFHRIMTPTQRKFAAAATGYACELAVERLLGETKAPIDGLRWVERGKVLEPHAVSHYEFLYGRTAKVGFISDVVDEDDPFAKRVMTPDGPVYLTMGCSPDRIKVDTVGGVEIKCPSADVHARYLVEGPEDEYKCQYQGSMMITGWPHWDFESYHDALPEIVYKFDRNEPFIADLRKCMVRFQTLVNTFCDQIKAQGEIGYGRSPLKTASDMNLASRIIETQNWGG